jgi:hypothetical protein
MIRRTLLWGIAGFLFSAAANATTIEFWFDDTDDSSNTLMTFTKDGITASAQGGTEGEQPGSRKVHQNAEGLGVYDPDIGDSSDIDGDGPDEFLNITFSESVRVLRIDFENVGDDDESALIIDGVQISFGHIATALDIAGASVNCSVESDDDECNLDVSSLNLVGTTFTFGDAISGGRSLDGDDDFRIEAMLIATVPEPGTLALMSIGLIGFGWMGRRRHVQ